MTNAIHLPRKRPSREELELPCAQITDILHDLNVALMQTQVALMAADTADAFAQALEQAHEKLAEADAGFSALVEATRGWQ